MPNRQWRGAACREAAARALAYLTKIRRIGIVARLSASFVAVAVLAVAANYLAGHSYVTQTTRVERPVVIISAPTPAPEIAAPAPAPLPPPKPSEAALEYSRAVQRFSAAVSARAAAADDELEAAYRAADMRLGQAAARLTTEVAKSDKKLAAQVTAATKETSETALALLHEADERRHLIGEYRRHLDQLAQSTKSALDGSFKIFGRLLAREYLLKLDANLQGIRERMEDTIASNASAASLAALAAGEHEFSATFGANRSSLQRVQGLDWVSSTDNQLSVLAAFRESLQHAQSAYGETLVKLSQQLTNAAVIAAECVVPPHLAAATQVPVPRVTTKPPAPLAPPAPVTPAPAASPGAPAAVDAAVESSAAAAPPEPETTTVAESDGGRNALIARITIAVIVSVFIISLLTVLSVVRPVRRLVNAAARLAAGDTRITVERGGIKELDQLAGSFNQMARHLESAGEASRCYQSRLEAEVAARTEELRQLAERDSLTQLPNRRHGLMLMEQALEDARRHGGYVGVYFLDLDNFKSINDSLGHAFGDKVLAGVAERLREVCAAYGHATRLGGDEFSIIHGNAKSCEEIYEAAEKLVQAFRLSLPLEQRELMVGVSCGVSVFPLHGDNCTDLLSCADAALYRAKSLGRNQASVYTADLLEVVSENFSIEQRLRRAIERDEFELVFQPEVGVRSLRVELVEALLRWRQPDGRLAAPGEFLAVAEASGFIKEIDNWVMRAAIEAAAQWHRGAWPKARVAINVSSRQLLDPSFVERLKQLMAEHSLPVECIEIELTETVLQTGAATIRTLHALEAEGFAIGLDDFGTGYSSLTSLAQLPLSRVKLDRSLVASSDERSAAIALATVTLCEKLELEVTAEGIETSQQLAWLLEHDSVYLQGYLISRPLRFANVEPALRTIPQLMALHVLNLRTSGSGKAGPGDVIPFMSSSIGM
jgi:diguanylate cyclase (GGDEF)-like protein